MRTGGGNPARTPMAVTLTPNAPQECKVLQEMRLDGKPCAVGDVVSINRPDAEYLRTIGRVEFIEPDATDDAPPARKSRKPRHAD